MPCFLGVNSDGCLSLFSHVHPGACQLQSCCTSACVDILLCVLVSLYARMYMCVCVCVQVRICASVHWRVSLNLFFFFFSPLSVLYLLRQATNESSLLRRNLIWMNLTAAAKVRRAECHFNPINFNLLVIKELGCWRMAVSQALYYTG